MNQAVTETELSTRAVAPRISADMLEENISSVNWINVGEAIANDNQADHERHHCLTLCVLVLKNGFVVTGESSCVNRENYDKGIGNRIAFENAKEKIWPLMGYALRDHMLYGGQSAWAQPALTRHAFWRPGEPDCPPEIKAGNGELHTMRCKLCGRDNPREDYCQLEPAPAPKQYLDGDDRRNGARPLEAVNGRLA